jgi:S1-C subfamily serine protease
MNSIVVAAVAALGLLASPQQAAVVGTLPVAEPASYVNDAQHVLVNPAVVRILHKFKGEFVVTPFRIDTKTLLAVSIPGLTETINQPVEELITGTGFSVSENGIFVSNAHVVSNEFLRYTFGAAMAVAMLDQEQAQLVATYGAQSTQVQDFNDRMQAVGADEQGAAAEALVKSVLMFVTYNDQDGGIVVLKQGASAETNEALYTAGIRADVLAVPDDWIGTERDVAVLKIDQSHEQFPAVALASTTLLGINTSVAAYGFPGSTDLGAAIGTDVTVTRGSITSVKPLPGTLVTAYQIDAKISRGSSGGPLVDGAGRVVGIVTLETGTDAGDNFGFALPVSLIHDLLEQAGITTLATQYQATVREGMALQEERHCKRAIEAYRLARTSLGTDATAESPVDGVISSCEALIASGRSIDTSFDAFKDTMRQVGGLTWMLIGGGAVLLIIIVVGGAVVFRKFREDKAELTMLEHEIEEEHEARSHDVHAQLVGAASASVPPGSPAPQPARERAVAPPSAVSMPQQEPIAAPSPVVVSAADTPPVPARVLHRMQPVPTHDTAADTPRVPVATEDPTAKVVAGQTNAPSTLDGSSWFVNDEPAARS